MRVSPTRTQRSVLAACLLACTACGAAEPRADRSATATPTTAVSDSTPPDASTPVDQPTAAATSAPAASGDRSTVYRDRLLAAADSLASRTQVPFRAPLFLAGAPADDSTFATVESATPDRYRVVLGDEGCDGGNYCRVGELTGRRVAAGTAPPAGKAVNLPGVGSAVFEESTCGASCGDAVLTWTQDGFRYSVALKAGELDDFRPIAASMTRLPLAR